MDKVASARLFTRKVSEEEVNQLEKPVTKQDIKDVLKGFSKDKIPGPDGWSVEFYLHFFDLIANDLLDAVEESARLVW
jgi:hypothetical protein